MSLKYLKSVKNGSSGIKQSVKSTGKLLLKGSVLAEDYQVVSESVQVRLINDIDDLSHNNLPFFIPKEVINEINTD